MVTCFIFAHSFGRICYDFDSLYNEQNQHVIVTIFFTVVANRLITNTSKFEKNAVIPPSMELCKISFHLLFISRSTFSILSLNSTKSCRNVLFSLFEYTSLMATYVPCTKSRSLLLLQNMQPFFQREHQLKEARLEYFLRCGFVDCSLYPLSCLIIFLPRSLFIYTKSLGICLT